MQTTIVTCPNCTTRFVAPTEKLQPEGRQVRCSNCRHTWFYKPTDAAEGFSSTHNANGNGTAGVIELRKPSLFGRLLFWLSLLAILAGVLGYAFRDQLVARIPALAPVYASAASLVTQGKAAVSDIIAPAQGKMRIESTKYDIQPGGDGSGKKIIVLSGIFNGSEQALTAPNLRVRMMGDDGALLKEERITPDPRLGPTIAPEERRSYQAEFAAPEAEVAKVLVDLAIE